MQEQRASRTAMRVAMHRAAHQRVDHPRVLDDAIAVPIVGEARVARAGDDRFSRAMRAFVVVRSRFAEDALARAVARGTRQYVVLGAGLDTFAYRNPFDSLRVFEVDHPATQAWKRRLLAEAGVPVPPLATLTPVDFERQSVAEKPERAGFDRGQPAFFSWLGVTMYLTPEAIEATLAFVASIAPGGGLAFDYAVPPSTLGLMQRLAHHALARRVAKAGEPFRTFFAPADLRSRLGGLGFGPIEDLGPPELNARYFSGRGDGFCVRGRLGRVLSAERVV